MTWPASRKCAAGSLVPALRPNCTMTAFAAYTAPTSTWPACFRRHPRMPGALPSMHGCVPFPSLDALLDAVEVVHVCASPAAHEAIAVAALARGVHAIVEKPLTGWFGDGTADFNAVRCVDAARAGRRAWQYRPHAGGRNQIEGDDPLRGELGVCAGYPEGARDHREDGRAGAVDAWRGSALRLAQQGLWLLAAERRRRAHRQGRAPADGRALSQARRRPRAARPAHPPGRGQRADAQPHASARTTPIVASCAPTTTTSRISPPRTSFSRTARSPISLPPRS